MKVSLVFSWFSRSPAKHFLLFNNVCCLWWNKYSLCQVFLKILWYSLCRLVRSSPIFIKETINFFLFLRNRILKWLSISSIIFFVVINCSCLSHTKILILFLFHSISFIYFYNLLFSFSANLFTINFLNFQRNFDFLCL